MRSVLLSISLACAGIAVSLTSAIGATADEAAAPTVVTPNDPEFEGSDVERINQAVHVAAERGLKVVVPRRNAKAAQGQSPDLWLLDSAILVEENTTLELDNCHIKLSDRCRDNFIRSANCGLGITDIRPISHVHIRGVGNVLLEGADHPRATGDSAKVLGKDTYGTDAGVQGENQKGDWRNVGILLAHVEQFSIENVTIKDSHCWAISLERCALGRVCDVHFDSLGFKMIDGVRQTILNQDGLDLRRGCHDISIERITGRTGDDLVALTNVKVVAVKGTPRVAGETTSTMVSPADCRYAGADDIRNIFIRNVCGHAEGDHVVRFLNSGGLRLYNIVLDGLVDTSPADQPCQATVKIGDANPAWGGVTPLGDTNRLFLNNISSVSRHTILIAGSLTDSCISNVVRYVPSGEPITYASGKQFVRNVQCVNMLRAGTPAEEQDKP